MQILNRIEQNRTQTSQLIPNLQNDIINSIKNENENTLIFHSNFFYKDAQNVLETKHFQENNYDNSQEQEVMQFLSKFGDFSQNNSNYENSTQQLQNILQAIYQQKYMSLATNQTINAYQNITNNELMKNQSSYTNQSYQFCEKMKYDFSNQQYLASWIILVIASIIMLVSLINMLYQQFRYKSIEEYFDEIDQETKFKKQNGNNYIPGIYSQQQASSYYNSMQFMNQIQSQNSNHMNHSNFTQNLDSYSGAPPNNYNLANSQLLQPIMNSNYQMNLNLPLGVQNQSGLFVNSGANSFIHFQQMQYQRSRQQKQSLQSQGTIVNQLDSNQWRVQYSSGINGANFLISSNEGLGFNQSLRTSAQKYHENKQFQPFKGTYPKLDSEE